MANLKIESIKKITTYELTVSDGEGKVNITLLEAPDGSLVPYRPQQDSHSISLVCNSVEEFMKLANSHIKQAVAC